jgi:hypothetical protein
MSSCHALEAETSCNRIRAPNLFENSHAFTNAHDADPGRLGNLGRNCGLAIAWYGDYRVSVVRLMSSNRAIEGT